MAGPHVWQCKMQPGCSLLVPAEAAALVGQAVWGILQSTAKASAPRALQEHTLLICEQHILWAEGAWIKTCRRIKINPGVYMWAEVMLEIRGRLWAVRTVPFFSTSTTPVAALFQVMREASSSMVLWDGRQPQELEALQMNSSWFSL